MILFKRLRQKRIKRITEEAVIESKKINSEMPKETFDKITEKITELCKDTCGYTKNDEYCESVRKLIIEHLGIPNEGKVEINKYALNRASSDIINSSRDKVRYDELKTYLVYLLALNNSCFPKLTKKEIELRESYLKTNPNALKERR